MSVEASVIPVKTGIQSLREARPSDVTIQKNTIVMPVETGMVMNTKNPNDSDFHQNENSLDLNLYGNDTLNSLFHLEQSCFQNGWTLQQIQDELNHADAWVFTYKIENILTGAIFWRLIGDELWLMRILVDPAHRRQKIASQLFESYRSIEQPFGSIWLEASQNNIAAIAFYKKHGFELVAERKNYYSPNDPSKSPHAFIFKKQP